MCECVPYRSMGWRGWIDVPPPRVPACTAPWTDLSHPMWDGLDRSPVLPAPRIGRIRSLPGDIANITELQMVVHFGTHIDAPCHFIADGPSIDQIPLERLYGPGVVWRLQHLEPLSLIEPAHLEQARPRLERGDMLLLDTGWAQHINTPLYEDHPSLSPAAAQWIVDQGVKLFGVDFSTPDLTAHLRPEGFDFPVHHILLSHGVLIAEHLTNLGSLANQRAEIMFPAINLKGSDGAPARAMARALPNGPADARGLQHT